MEERAGGKRGRQKISQISASYRVGGVGGQTRPAPRRACAIRKRDPTVSIDPLT